MSASGSGVDALLDSSLRETSVLIRERKLSPLALLEACLARIEWAQPHLNAFITVITEEARAAAERAEREIAEGHWRGPLHGIPVAVKDFFDTAGVRTTAAFAPFAERVPERDAELVSRLREAGAMIVGKTNMHELGMGTTSLTSHFGPVRNPWNPDYVAGGSSGGSAAAVAAGLVYATLDTDAIGSGRLPAACCGVVGFKGTYGLLSSKGILEGEEADEIIVRLSHPALTCRRVADVAALLEALSEGPQREGFSSRDTMPRLGVVTNSRATAEVQANFEEVVRLLSPYIIDDLEAPLDAPFDVTHIERDRGRIAGTLFETVDVLLLPTLIEPVASVAAAEAAGPQAVASAHTFFANYYGLPAVSVPCGFSKTGLPLGLQFIGRPGGDFEVLRAASFYESQTRWHREHPATS